MKKRLLSLLLTLAMLVSLIPVTASAGGTNDYVKITNVKLEADIVCVMADIRTSVDSSLVFAGYSETGKLLISTVKKVSPAEIETGVCSFPCSGLETVGALATVKVFALGPDNRLLGMPYETRAYSANPTKDGGTWEYRSGEELDWQYDNGTLTITNNQGGANGLIPGTGDLTPMNSYPWENYKDRVTTLNLVNIGYVGGYVFSEYSALETVRSDAALHVAIEGFSKCPNLKTVDARIDTLGPSAFMNCGSLEELDLRYAQSIGQEALSGTAIRQVILLNSQVELHGEAFKGMSNLVYVSLCTPGIPASLMQDRDSLQVVAGLEEVGFIDEGAFKNSGINAYHSSAYNVQIEAEAFAECDNLRTVSIPNPSTLGKRAFAQANIADLTLNASVISKEAFTIDGEDNDKFVEMARVELINTESIGQKAFWRRSIGDLYIPATLTTLEDDAFGNTEIRVLHLPAKWGLGEKALQKLEEKAEADIDWEWLQEAETILDSEGKVLKGETDGDGEDSGEDGDGNDIVMSEETTESTVPETTPEATPETTPATVPETTPETTSPTETQAPETEAPKTEAPIDPENFDSVYVVPEGASMEEVPVAEGMAAFTGTDTVSGEKHTVKFTGLAPESAEPYVLIVSGTPGDLENLQYIDYGYADAKGQLTMTYIPKQSGNYTVQLYGPQGTGVQPSLSQDYVTLEVGKSFTLEVLNAENMSVFWGFADQNQDIVSLQPIPLGADYQAFRAKDVGITQVQCKVIDWSTGFEKELSCTVEVVDQPTVLEAHLMDTKATKELFSDIDNPRIYISLTKRNAAVVASEGDLDTDSAETTIIKDARFAEEELNNYFKLLPVNDRTLEIVSKLPDDISNVKTSYVSAIEVKAGENEDYLTTPETLKLTVKKSMPKVTAKTVTINAWNAGADVPVLFNQDAEVWHLWEESEQLLEELGITASYGWENDYNLVLHTKGLSPDTPKQTLKIYPTVGLKGWVIGWRTPVTVNIVNTPITAKLSASKITLSSVNSKGTDLKLVPPKGYSIQDLGIRQIAVDSDDYTLGVFDPSTGSFHLTPQEGGDYRNPVPGKINIQVTYANGVTDELPLTVTTKAPTVKPKKTSFSFLNGVMDVQAAAFTVSPADYDLSAFDLNDMENCPLVAGDYLLDPENPGKVRMVAQATLVPGENSKAEDYLGAGIDALGVMGCSNGYVGTVKLTFDQLPGVKPFTVTVKFTKNTPTMTLKVNGTIDASKTNKVTLTTTIKNLSPAMQTIGETEVTLFDPQGNPVDPGRYVVDTPDESKSDVLTLYRRPEMLGALEPGTYTVQVTRNVYSMFDEETPIPLTATAKLKVVRTTSTMKLSQSRVTLNPFDGKGAEIKVTFPKDQYMDSRAFGWLDAEGDSLSNGEEAPFARWADENTITIDTFNPNTGKPINLPDGVYYLCAIPDYLDSDAKTAVIPVTVQRKALKSVKTWKEGTGVSMVNWNGYQEQGFFLPMTEQVFKYMDRNWSRYFTVTLQGSNDNRNFTNIPTMSSTESYYPIGISYNMDFFPAGKYDWGTLKEDCAYFSGIPGGNPSSGSGDTATRVNYELYRYHRFHLVVEDGNDGVIFEQYVKLDVKDPVLKITQAKVPTLDRRDLTKPFAVPLKLNEKNFTLAAGIAEDSPWSSLVRVTNLDAAGNLTLVFQDAIAMSDVGKSVTIPVTVYVPFGRQDQVYTVDVKVNFQ